MREAKHTPGPWQQGTNSGHNAAQIYAHNGDGICQLYEVPLHTSVSEIKGKRYAAGMANARLIAAAPELLAACKAVAAHLVTTFPPYTPGESPMDKVRAAIAKAEDSQ